jgi:methylated-DNA-[protein]-cysteine S-methyltransferase
MKYCYIDTKIGKLLLSGNKKLEGLYFPTAKIKKEPEESWIYSENPFMEVLDQLNQYFKGSLKKFDLSLYMKGTEFQKKVWKELTRIPYGETISYGELALRVGNPKAARAVGMANNKNPIPVIVPCHRVIGKDGKLTGFGGGLDVKQVLLDLEQKY